MEAAVRHTFSRDERLKLRRDFRRCIKQGGRAVGRAIIVFVADNPLGITRLGAGTTKRLGGAVRRNRAKRLVREAFRLSKHELPASVDMVVLPRVPWPEPDLEALKRDLIDTARRAAEDLARQTKM